MADIRAMEEIKNRLRTKVSNEYHDTVRKPNTDIGECRKKIGKDFVKELEGAVITAIGKKYGLKGIPVCKVGTSRCDFPEGYVQLGFYVTIPQDEVKKLQAIITKADKTREEKLKKIDDWEMSALTYIAARKGEDGTEFFPEIPKI
jgi:hypothetical protein